MCWYRNKPSWTTRNKGSTECLGQIQDHSNVRLLKLVTGVEISTRLVSSAGSDGNTVKSSKRRAAAAAKRAKVRVSYLMASLMVVKVSLCLLACLLATKEHVIFEDAPMTRGC